MSRGSHIEKDKDGEDKLFHVPRERVDDFDFGKETAAVFDNMLNRSVPFYGEIQRMVGELAADFATKGSNIFDLGCSTCTTFLAVGRCLPQELKVRFIGVDSSEDMLREARKKLVTASFGFEHELRCADLNEGVHIENASAVLMLLTLQFVRPLNRDHVLGEIYRGLNDQGCLIIVEKVLGEQSLFNRLFIKHYYEMKKRHGYSRLEIAQKREALENVLVPYKLEENKQLLKRAGFQDVEIFFKWYNFCGMVAMKQPPDAT